MLAAPTNYQGSWSELFRDHIEPNLPSVESVGDFHRWLTAYSQDPKAVFSLRAVGDAERRKIYSTCDGTKIAPSDNAPAWAVQALLMEGRLGCFEDFQRLMADLPTHMFDVPKVAKRTANTAGWYVAHIFPNKNRDTNFREWNRAEVQRRFFLSLHPCNMFLVPGTRNSKDGEDPRIISFVASQYAIRYGALWPEFLRLISITNSISDASFGNLPASMRCASRMGSRIVKRSDKAELKASYHATRLTFRREYIEPLPAEEEFEVITPMGVYRFTKQEFCYVFSNVLSSPSYRDRGLYHYPNPPRKAQKFKITDH